MKSAYVRIRYIIKLTRGYSVCSDSNYEIVCFNFFTLSKKELVEIPTSSLYFGRGKNSIINHLYLSYNSKSNDLFNLNYEYSLVMEG